MSYLSMPLAELPGFYGEYIKQPCALRLNLTPPERGILVAYPEGQEVPAGEAGVITICGHHGGGVMVVFQDGITLFDFNRENRPARWHRQLCSYLQAKGLAAEIAGNDVLVEGRKVAGWMNRFVAEGMLMNGIHISINADPIVIRHYTDKPMEKIPAGLSEWGISRAEILEALEVEE